MTTPPITHDTKQSSRPVPASESPGQPLGGACDAEHFLRALRAGSAWLEHNVPSVNALNVFPVPDGDTGTNMSLTMQAALNETNGRSYDTVSELMHVLSHGALMGARGNSGVILSQVLRGLARALDGKLELDAAGFAQALTEGATTAYKGVMKPVEGTILTVVREAAQAACREADRSDATLVDVAEAALAEGRRSVQRTPSLLPVLAEAGVVDAGGQGFVVLLEGILRDMRGERIEALATVAEVAEHAHDIGGEYNYDTQFIIQGANLNVDAIRDWIATMGDSVLVVGDEQAVKVHVHSDNPGLVLEYGISQGQVTAVIIENMQLQYQEFMAGQSVAEPEALGPLVPDPMGEIGVVAVAAGEGLQRVFESLGVSIVVPGGQTMNPSTQDLLTAIERVPRDEVIVLPNNGNIILTAEQAKTLSSKRVAVVPTKTVPQGIASLLALNYQLDLETNLAAMLEASKQVQSAEITRAVRSVQVNGLSIEEGQIIGLLNDNLVTAGEDIIPVAMDLYERMEVEDYEILTIYYGEEMTLEEAEELAEHTRARYPELEVEVINGGQAHYFCIISIE